MKIIRFIITVIPVLFLNIGSFSQNYENIENTDAIAGLQTGTNEPQIQGQQGQQTSGQSTSTQSAPQNQPSGQTAPGTQSRILAQGYRGVSLGMNIDQVREVIKKDRLLEIDIRTDFDDLDEEPYHVLRARNIPYIDSVYYQFGTTESVKRKLFAIIIHFNKNYNDFMKLYFKMKNRYDNVLPFKIETTRFENDLIKRIPDEERKKFVQNLYSKDNTGNIYILKENLPDSDRVKLRKVLSAIGWQWILLTPNMASWEDGETKIILNSPSTVKYINIPLYRSMQREYLYMRHRYFPPTDETANNELTDDL